jgi:hypothetical protein
MHAQKALVRTLAGAVAGLILLTFATAAEAESCPNLPSVSWWDTSPDKIVRYVDQAFRGEWEPYIARWEDYRFRMEQIHQANGAAVVRSRNLRLEGEQLARHIQDIDQRLQVTRCLKEKYGGKYV